MAVRKIIQPTKVMVPKTAYSQGIEVTGRTHIYVSGQLAFDTSGVLVGEGDFTAQLTQVFENIGALLEEARASFNDVVKINYYITDIMNFPLIQKVRVNYLTKPYPASTLVAVSALVNPQALVEIEAIAVI